MTICLNNKSELCIKIFIGESQIVLHREEIHMHTLSDDLTPIKIMMSISNTEICPNDKTAISLNISTVVLCDFTDSSNPTLIINKKLKKFQNYTTYQYLTMEAFGLKIYDTKHKVDNCETSKNIATYNQELKRTNVLHIIKNSFIDMLLDGLPLSALLAWIFSWKVALSTLLAIFLIALLINCIKLKTSKSKYRILNWGKDMEEPDDIEHFITNIEKYCN